MQVLVFYVRTFDFSFFGILQIQHFSDLLILFTHSRRAEIRFVPGLIFDPGVHFTPGWNAPVFFRGERPSGLYRRFLSSSALFNLVLHFVFLFTPRWNAILFSFSPRGEMQASRPFHPGVKGHSVFYRSFQAVRYLIYFFIVFSFSPRGEMPSGFCRRFVSSSALLKLVL